MENPVNEDQLQAKCVMWFDETFPAERKMLFAVPNGGERPMKLVKGRWINVEGNKLMAMGVKPGVSDLILVTHVVTFIEMKFGTNTLSPDQMIFSRKVSERGHEQRTIYSFEEFTKFVTKKIIEYERAKI